MMNVLRRLFLLITLVAINNQLFSGYEFDFSNFLDTAIVVKVNQRRMDNKDYYQIINSFESAKQVFNNVYCLEKLAWAPYDASKPLNGGMDLVDPTTGRVFEENQRLFGDKVAPRYAFSPVQITMLPNDVFQKTADAATILMGGIEKFGCQAINEAKSFSGLKAAENLAGSATATEGTDVTEGDPEALLAMPEADESSTATGQSSSGSKECSFGLTEIGAGAAELAKLTICKSRAFMFVKKLSKKNKPIKDYRFGGRPVVLALTGEGE